MLLFSETWCIYCCKKTEHIAAIIATTDAETGLDLREGQYVQGVCEESELRPRVDRL